MKYRAIFDLCIYACPNWNHDCLFWMAGRGQSSPLPRLLSPALISSPTLRRPPTPIATPCTSPHHHEDFGNPNGGRNGRRTNNSNSKRAPCFTHTAHHRPPPPNHHQHALGAPADGFPVRPRRFGCPGPVGPGRYATALVGRPEHATASPWAIWMRRRRGKVSMLILFCF